MSLGSLKDYLKGIAFTINAGYEQKFFLVDFNTKPELQLLQCKCGTNLFFSSIMKNLQLSNFVWIYFYSQFSVCMSLSTLLAS